MVALLSSIVKVTVVAVDALGECAATVRVLESCTVFGERLVVLWGLCGVSANERVRVLGSDAFLCPLSRIIRLIPGPPPIGNAQRVTS
jgi:hypothetical protein